MSDRHDMLNRLVDELIGVLDEDILRISSFLQRLDQLRASVIKRDEEGLKILLEAVGSEDSSYRRIEEKRQNIRTQLAKVIGCGVKDMNLTRLCMHLDAVKQQEVSRKQQELKDLVRRLGVEHKATVLLLRGCSRLNNMMLRAVLGKDRMTVTYNRRGNASWELPGQMVSFKM